MKEITILSGKGGAGKTSVAAAFASFAKKTVFCDNDVDASDLHLIFNPVVIENHTFDSGSKASINEDLCIDCGLCTKHCRFSAIHTNKNGMPEINPFQCEGCRLCERICPEEAITTSKYFNNHWFVSTTRFGHLVHAKMGPGEENSGKLVTRIREKAREIAVETNAEYILNDGPPGIGCSAIASVTGTDAVVVVIEPTISGLHDAERLLKLVDSFKIPVFAVINKFDINPAFLEEVTRYLTTSGIPLIGKLPFSRIMVDAMVAGKTVVEFDQQHELSIEISKTWELLTAKLNS